MKSFLRATTVSCLCSGWAAHEGYSIGARLLISGLVVISVEIVLWTATP